MENRSEIYSITLPDGACFPCRSDENVLEAMRRFGHGPIISGCFGGGCGVCAMRVISGEYVCFKPMSRAHVSVEHEQQGLALLCCIKPLSDLTLGFAGEK